MSEITYNGFLFTPFDSKINDLDPNLSCDYQVRKSSNGPFYKTFCNLSYNCKKLCFLPQKFTNLDANSFYDIQVTFNKNFDNIYFYNLPTGILIIIFLFVIL